MASIRVLNNGSIAQDRYVAFTVPYAIAAGLNSTLPTKLGVTIGSTEYEAFAVKQENTSPGGTGTPNDTDKLLFLCKGPWPTGADTYTLDAPGNNEPDVFVFPAFANEGGSEQCGPPSTVLGGNGPQGLLPLSLTPRYTIIRSGQERQVGTHSADNWIELWRTATAILYRHRMHSETEGITCDFFLEIANGSSLARFWCVPNYFNPYVAAEREILVDSFRVYLGQEAFLPYQNTVDMNVVVDGSRPNPSYFEWPLSASVWGSRWRDGRDLPNARGYIFGRVAGTTVTADENLFADIKTNGDIDGHGSALLDRTSWQNYWGPWSYLPSSDTNDVSVTNINLATVETDGVGRSYEIGTEAAPATARRNDNTGYQSAWGTNFGGDIVDGKITMDTLLACNGYQNVVQMHFRERGGEPIEFANHPGLATDPEWIPWTFGSCNDSLGKDLGSSNKLRFDEPNGAGGSIARNHSQQHTVLNPLWTEYALTMNPMAAHNIHDVMQMAIADHRIFRPSRGCGFQDSNHREFGRRMLSVIGCGVAYPEVSTLAREYYRRAFESLQSRWIGRICERNGTDLRMTRTSGQTAWDGNPSTFYWDPVFDTWCPLMILLAFERGYADAAERDFALRVIDAAWQYGSINYDPLGGSNRFWFLAYRLAHTLDGTNAATTAQVGSNQTSVLLANPAFGTAWSTAKRTDTDPDFGVVTDPGGDALRSWGLGCAVIVREYAENGKDPNNILSTATKNRAYADTGNMISYYRTGTPAKWAQISMARFGSLFSPY